MGVPSWCLISVPVGGARAREGGGGGISTHSRSLGIGCYYTLPTSAGILAQSRGRDSCLTRLSFYPGLVVSTAMARITLERTTGSGIIICQIRALFFSFQQRRIFIQYI